ncbi:HlyD family efflux transporter periplasmic adaptor subunit [Mariniblastus fucicola]|uniref:Putative efflux pump membrane fusion protein n=1 Tax=Mariniblastus fucicola TaxID=980251 RepID=A0A5B9P769_9BACT|nr:HlyD family efflux transporter periplasmic adaptor subunit [Mariniblastus fucicola]QEG22477.1 putative efflux pump membrane fusion protein [Mariniblastus fucicola]
MEPSKKTDSQPEIRDSELPLDVVKHNEMQTSNQRQGRRRIPRFFWLAFIPLFLFTGGVIGIYVQPPPLRYFLKITGLRPGGGTSNPIAVPVEQDAESEPEQATIRTVVALGRLVPEGKVITISPPFGAGDARIDEIKVEIGSRVERGETLALLDNRASLESAVASAEANVALQRTALAQTRMTIGAGLGEAQAALDRAKAGEALALQEYKRMKNLRGQNAVSQSELDQASAEFSQSRKDVAMAEATVTRFTAQEMETQPDVAVAKRKLDAAIADLNRAKHDLARGIVTAPVTGTILDIYARPGEKPGTKGILDIANVQRMTAELEVYQSEIGVIAVGQHVELSADPLTTSLFGIVSEIGFAVERQTTIRDDPAANTDARVIRVTVNLDADSSKRAARLTNLEVTGRIAVEDAQ